MKRPQNTILVVIIVFAIAIFAGLNTMMNRAGGSPEPEEAAQEKAAAETTAANQAPPTAAGATPVQLPTDESVGPANAPVKVVVGWTWTPDVQGNPQALQAAIQAIRQAVPDAQVRVVNVDAAPDVSPGIQVNGRTVMELPENGIVKPADAARAVAATSNTNR